MEPAITVDDPARRLADALSRRFGEDIPVTADGPGLEALASIAAHCTHRRWSPRSVEPSTMRLLLACALSAPSKSDLQQADIVEVRDPTRRAALAGLLPSLPWFNDAPSILVFCGNGRRLRQCFERRGMPFTNEHLDSFFNATVDASLVLMNSIRAAAALGLVCCPISILRNHPDEVAEILELPRHVFPVAGLCIGYPVLEGRVVPRLPLSLTCHVDRFDDSDSEAQIASYDQRRLAIEAHAARVAGRIEPTTPWSMAKTDQYALPQRDDWGRFVRDRGFGTD